MAQEAPRTSVPPQPETLPHQTQPCLLPMSSLMASRTPQCHRHTLTFSVCTLQIQIRTFHLKLVLLYFLSITLSTLPSSPLTSHSAFSTSAASNPLPGKSDFSRSYLSTPSILQLSRKPGSTGHQLPAILITSLPPGTKAIRVSLYF